MEKIMWAIAHKHGLYTGTWLRRADAIREHTRMKGKSWNDCKKDGDRVVKVKMLIIEKK